MPEDPIKKVESAIKSEPWYVWAGAAGAAGIVVYYVWQRRKASTTASTSTSATGTAAADAAALNGYTVDSMAGLPFGADSASGYNYQGGPMANTGSYSEVGVNGNNVPIIPYGDVPIYDGSGNLIGWQTPGPTTSPSPSPTPSTSGVAVIRQRTASGPWAGFDKNGTGPNLYDSGNTGSNTVIGHATYGASEPVISGPQTIGGLIWYQLANGWILAQDLASVNGALVNAPSTPASPMHPATGIGGGGDAGGFHLPINAGRATMDQWTFSNGMHQDFDSHAMVGE